MTITTMSSAGAGACSPTLHPVVPPRDAAPGDAAPGGAGRRERDGRVLVSWAEIGRISSEGYDILRYWHQHRAETGHPVGEKIGRERWFDEAEWWSWYDDYRTRLRAGLSTVARVGDPNELVGAPEVARMLGYAHTTTLTSYITRGQFIDADDTTPLPSGRLRRRWRRRTIWDYAPTRRRSWTPPATSNPDPATDSPTGPDVPPTEQPES